MLVWSAHASPRVRARFFILARNFKSDLCIAASYVQVPQNDGCAAQANPNANPWGGSRSALEVGGGSFEFTFKSEKLARTCN